MVFIKGKGGDNSGLYGVMEKNIYSTNPEILSTRAVENIFFY